MCCQRYVILHATRRSERTHLRGQDWWCKNTQTSATRLFGFLRNEVWWWMALARTFLFHIDLWGLFISGVVITVVLLPLGESVLSFLYLFCWGHMVVIYPQTHRGMGGQTDWISLFTKQGSDTPVFALNLGLTSCCPFVFLLCRMPFLISFCFSQRGGQSPPLLLQDLISGVRRYISEQCRKSRAVNTAVKWEHCVSAVWPKSIMSAVVVSRVIKAWKE